MIQNGEVWQNRGSCHQAIVQWLDGDQWCLLSVPYKAVHGTTAMMVHVERDGKWMYTQDELERRLTEEGWFKVDAAVVLQEKKHSFTSPYVSFAERF